MATVHDLSRRKLIALAQSFEISRADEAAGRCLSVSLDFALAVRERFGKEVDLVKWRVVGDPSFVDHWAVRLDDDTVIDLSHVQVDGRRRLVGPVTDYPVSYQAPRDYPSAMLLDAYAATLTTREVRLTNQFLWTCGTRLLAHDLARAWGGRDAVLALSVLRELQTFLACFTYGWLARALERRITTLVARLHAQPDFSALRTEAMPLEFPTRGTAGRLAAAAMLSLQITAPQIDFDEAVGPVSRPRMHWAQPAIAA